MENNPPKTFQSRLVYPDLFKPVGIEFDLPEDATITLEVLNDSGDPILTVVDRQLYTRGKHIVQLGKIDQPHRVAFYRIVGTGVRESFKEVKKLSTQP